MATQAQRLSPRASLAAVVLCVIAGSALGLLVMPRAPKPASSDKAGPPRLTYLGKPLSPKRGAIDEALERTRTFASRSFSLGLGGENYRALSLSELGAEIDTVRLTQLIRDARDPGSRMRRYWSRIARGKVDIERNANGVDVSHELPVPISIDVQTALPELLRLKDRLDRLPRDAKLDLTNQSIIPHVTGRWLDVDGTLTAIDRALAKGKLKADAVYLKRKPKREADSLKGLSFERVLGHFETRYSRSQKYADRTFNLRVAASKLDGTVLLPGEVFDFNEVVGPRDEANGYKVATVIADGELVDGIGGGTCQISGTLHGAAFFAGLEIVERYPHTRPSSYIKMGMDATVVYPTINFRVKNPFDFPVVLHEKVSNGRVRAEVLGPHVDQVVTLIRRVDEAIPYEEVERPDPSLPRGARALAQRGIPGFRLHRYRVIRRGSHTVRERWRDIYPPTAQIIRVGTGSDEGSKPPRSVPTPEYLADELLVLTLKRPREGSAGEFAENREPGKFGTPGWTREAGMPFWERQE